MMRSFLTGACVAVMVSPVCASPTSEAKTQIQQAYQKRSNAWSRKNSVGYLADLTPDYRVIYNDRTFSRAAVERQMKTWFSSSQRLQVQTVVTGFVLDKGEAVAVVKEKTTVTGLNPRTKKAMLLETLGTAEDTWILRQGKWRLKQTRTTSLTAKLDGKPYSVHLAQGD